MSDDDDDERRGPRDWSPTDPESQWWNPRTGDAYGPSDQEHRQPWEPPARERRFGPGETPVGAGGDAPPAGARPRPVARTAPPPPSQTERRANVNLALILGTGVTFTAACVATALGVFVERIRYESAAIMMLSANALLEMVVLACLVVVYRAGPGNHLAGRVVFWLLALPVAATPVVGGLLLAGGSRDAGYQVAGAGLAVAVLGAIVGGELRRRRMPAADRLPFVTVWVVAPLGLAVVVACCVGGVRFIDGRGGGDPLAGRGTPVPAMPAPSTPKPSWRPGQTGVLPAPILDHVRYGLESQVLEVAAVHRPMSSECRPADPDLPRNQVIPCTVTYAGVVVAFTVRVSGAARSPLDFTPSAAEMVLTRDAVHQSLRDEYPRAERLRCDDMPEVALHRVRTKAPVACYVKEQFDDTFEVTVTVEEDRPPTVTKA